MGPLQPLSEAQAEGEAGPQLTEEESGGMFSHLSPLYRGNRAGTGRQKPEEGSANAREGSPTLAFSISATSLRHPPWSRPPACYTGMMAAMKMAWSPQRLLCSLHMHSVPGALYVCTHRISPRRNAGRDYRLRVADGETEAGVQYFRPAGKCGAGACPHSVVSGDTASLLGFAVAPGSHSTSPAGGIRGSGISDGCACAGKGWGRPQSLDRGLRLRY